MKYTAPLVAGLVICASPAAAVDGVWEINLQGPNFQGLVVVFENSDLDIVPTGMCGLRLSSVGTHYWNQTGPEPGFGGQVLPGQAGTPPDSSPEEIRIINIPHLGPACGDPGSDAAVVEIDGTEVDWVGAGLGQLVVQDADWEWLDANGDPRERLDSCQQISCRADVGLTLDRPPVFGNMSVVAAILSAEAVMEEVAARADGGMDSPQHTRRLEHAANGLSLHLRGTLLHKAVSSAERGEMEPAFMRLSEALAETERCLATTATDDVGEACERAARLAREALRQGEVPFLRN